jgi:hypothetical protein
MRALMLVVLTGCSFFATEGPRPPPGPTACNRDMKSVRGDAITTIGATVFAGVASAMQADGRDVLAGFGVAGLFGASTVYGLVQVRRCRAEHVKRPAWSLAEMPAVM